MAMKDTHTRWGHWPVKGAYGPSGGHVKALGFMYAWSAGGPSWEFDLFGIFAVGRQCAENDVRWAFGKLTLNFHRARNRFYKCEQKRFVRRYRRQRGGARLANGSAENRKLMGKTGE